VEVLLMLLVATHLLAFALGAAIMALMAASGKD
jgi:hypothetical protein